MKQWFSSFLITVTLCSISGLILAVENKDYYQGNYGPGADYILSGGLIKDVPTRAPGKHAFVFKIRAGKGRTLDRDLPCCSME